MLQIRSYVEVDFVHDANTPMGHRRKIIDRKSQHIQAA